MSGNDELVVSLEDKLPQRNVKIGGIDEELTDVEKVGREYNPLKLYIASPDIKAMKPSKIVEAIRVI